MQSLTNLSSLVAACALLSTPLIAQGGGPGGGPGGNGGNGAIIAYIDTLPMQAIDPREEAYLAHMREEEKLARDTYRTLFASSGLNIFNNIAQAEQSHMELVLYVMTRNGIADPLFSDDVGVFPNPAFTQLFRRMVTFGQQSSLHALFVGAIIEDLDIYDLDWALAHTDNRDVGTVWQNLARGSRNHMRSFYGQLQNLGVTYNAQWISSASMAAIINGVAENQAVDENGAVLP